MRGRQWGGGAELRRLYEYSDDDRSRMGHCDWLPSNGDLCLCVEHSGDCFFTYVALRKQGDGKWRRAGKFGAYVFGTPCGVLPERTFHLACAGEAVELRTETTEVRR